MMFAATTHRAACIVANGQCQSSNRSAVHCTEETQFHTVSNTAYLQLDVFGFSYTLYRRRAVSHRLTFSSGSVLHCTEEVQFHTALTSVRVQFYTVQKKQFHTGLTSVRVQFYTVQKKQFHTGLPSVRDWA